MPRGLEPDAIPAVFVAGSIFLTALGLAVATVYARRTGKRPTAALKVAALATAQLLFGWLLPRGRHTNYDEATSVRALEKALAADEARKAAADETQEIPVVTGVHEPPTLECAPQGSPAAGLVCAPQDDDEGPPYRAPVDDRFFDRFSDHPEEDTERTLPRLDTYVNKSIDAALWPPMSGELDEGSPEDEEPPDTRTYTFVPKQPYGRHAQRKRDDDMELIPA